MSDWTLIVGWTTGVVLQYTSESSAFGTVHFGELGVLYVILFSYIWWAIAFCCTDVWWPRFTFCKIALIAKRWAWRTQWVIYYSLPIILCWQNWHKWAALWFWNLLLWFSHDYETFYSYFRTSLFMYAGAAYFSNPYHLVCFTWYLVMLENSLVEDLVVWFAPRGTTKEC